MLKADKNPCKHAQGVVNAAVPDSYCATITITFADVIVEDGEFYSHREEEVWEGDFHAPSCAMNGTGKRTIKDDPDAGGGGDTIQEGEFKDGELHGQGRRTGVGGHTEVGEFYEGTLSSGKITYSDGTVHEGKWRPEFEGTITFPDGRVEPWFHYDKHGKWVS